MKTKSAYIRIFLLIFVLGGNLFSQTNSQLECSRYSVLISVRDSLPRVDSKTGKTFYMPREHLLGTGFLLYDDILGTNLIYLVTNKHVVQDGDTKKFWDQLTLNLKSKVFSGEILGLIGDPLPLVIKKDTKIGAKMFNELVDTGGYCILWRDDTTFYSDIIVAKVFDYFYLKNEGGHEFINKPCSLSTFIPYDSILVQDDIFSFGFPRIIKEYDQNLSEYFDFPTNYPYVLCPGRIIDKIKKKELSFKLGSYICKDILILDMPALNGQSGSPVFIEKNGRNYLAGVFSGTFDDNGWVKDIAWPIDIIYRIIERNKDYFINLN